MVWQNYRRVALRQSLGAFLGRLGCLGSSATLAGLVVWGLKLVDDADAQHKYADFREVSINARIMGDWVDPVIYDKYFDDDSIIGGDTGSNTHGNYLNKTWFDLSPQALAVLTTQAEDSGASEDGFVKESGDIPTIVYQVNPGQFSNALRKSVVSAKNILPSTVRSTWLSDDGVRQCFYDNGYQTEAYYYCIGALGEHTKNVLDLYSRAYKIPRTVLSPQLEHTRLLPHYEIAGVIQWNEGITLVPSGAISVLQIEMKSGVQKLPIRFYARPNFSDAQPLTGTEKLAYDWVQRYQATLDAAAQLFWSHHQEYSLNWIRLVMRQRMYHDIQLLDSTDAWQDQSACETYNCPSKQAFRDVFNGSNKVGVDWQGQLRQPWPVAWHMQSLRWQYDRMVQGYGPMQNIPSVLVWARDYQFASEDYRDAVPELWSSNDRDIINAQLDPRKSIYSTALALDALVTMNNVFMEQTPNFRYAADRTPFIADQSSAKRFLAIAMARELERYPEYAAALSQLGAADKGDFVSDMLTASFLFNIPFDFSEAIWIKPFTVNTAGDSYYNSIVVIPDLFFAPKPPWLLSNGQLVSPNIGVRLWYL